MEFEGKGEGLEGKGDLKINGEGLGVWRGCRIKCWDIWKEDESKRLAGELDDIVEIRNG